MIGRYWEDFTMGEKFQTARRTIFESDVLQFCNLTWLNMSLFFDDKYAREETIYKSRVVPGPFIVPLALGLFLKLGLYERTAVSLLDIKNMKFYQPLHPGDTIQAEITIVDKKATKNPKHGILILKFDVMKHDKTQIMTFEMVHLIKRKVNNLKK